MKYNTLPIAVLHECFIADAEAGLLVWLERPLEHFRTRQGQAVTNARQAGKIAGKASIQGYIQVYVTYKGRTVRMQAHRVLWAMHHGRWPDSEIDHINGDRSDNRITNLRDASRTENARNRAISMRNSTGVTGVYASEDGLSWSAYIGVEGQARYLGEFPSRDMAIGARLGAERALGYHENHGRAGPIYHPDASPRSTAC